MACSRVRPHGAVGAVQTLEVRSSGRSPSGGVPFVVVMQAADFGDLDDPPPIVREDDKREQDPECGGWRHEEVRRRELRRLIGEKGPPVL